MSMLGANGNETRSYLEFVDALRQYSAAPKEVMRALWRGEASRLGLSSSDIDRMASAFEHEDLQRALKPRSRVGKAGG
jgi:hypothetical protein